MSASFALQYHTIGWAMSESESESARVTHIHSCTMQCDAHTQIEFGDSWDSGLGHVMGTLGTWTGQLKLHMYVLCAIINCATLGETHCGNTSVCSSVAVHHKNKKCRSLSN